MRRLFTTSIRNKLLLNTGTGTGLVLLATLAAMFVTWQSLQTYQGLLGRSVAIQERLAAVERALDQQLLAWKDILLLGSDPARERAVERFERAADKVQREASALGESLSDTERGGELVAELKAQHEEMNAGYREGLTMFVDSGFIQLTAQATVEGLAGPPRKTLDALKTYVENQLQGLATRTGERALDNLLICLGAMLVAVVIAFCVFLLLLRRSVTRPAHALVDNLERMAAGDFTQPVPRHTEDELGRVARAAEQLRQDMGALIGRVHSAVQQLGESAEQAAAVAEHNRTAVKSQQQETDQVATAMNEMSATIQEVARHAGEASESATAASHESATGRKVVEATVRDIDQLATRIEEAGKAVEQLDEHSTAIGSVLNVIREIAEQTNLLALNAAIEAARAGEQGRGFAVVAEEVRALARRTAESTEEIQRTIEALQSGSRHSVSLMSASREGAASTVEQARGAGEALGRIDEAVARIGEMNTQIASATEQQSSTSEEMNRSISHIAQVADDSAEAASETTRASQSLKDLAEELRGLVDRFQVADAR
ncbi:methyl-accepting chemotaxis protein [Arhodomonas sp. AD133]|uniref:methyl-accepting chemotaxis protein n=1 Tax=Arhodomonas sp. AD133 TaxID=3415009 RepID=UPI003EBDD8FD